MAPAPDGRELFLAACRRFADTISESYPDHLLVLLASEPPSPDGLSSACCAHPDHDKMGVTVQMVAGLMMQNRKIRSLLVAAVGDWICRQFGPDREQQYMAMLDRFMDELRTEGKEMSPNADGQ